MSMQAKNAVRIYEEVLAELPNAKVTLTEAVDGRGQAMSDQIKATALALTQSVLIADAIGNTLGDIGPLISTAIDNVSERLS